MYGMNNMKMDLNPTKKAMRSIKFLLSLKFLSKFFLNKIWTIKLAQ